jgi:hypothetical protein
VNCKSLRQLLLQTDSSDRPSAAATTHLDGCAECRVWQKRLGRLEEATRQLPTRRSSARVKFLWKFLTTEDPDAGASQAGAARERLKALADLAESLHGETRGLVHAADDQGLSNLAGLFEQVVLKDIVTTARTLPVEERHQAIDPIVDRLARTRSDLDSLAETATLSAGDSLHRIGKAAENSDFELRALLDEAGPAADA